MASLIETLIMILEEETGCYKTLLLMADNKMEVIINGNVPGLQEITKQEQDLAGHILRLEKRREENLEDICLVTNKKREDMTVQRLADSLKGPAKDRLKAVSQELMEILSDLKVKNETNRQLIQQSLDFVNFTVNAVQSAASPPESNTYQAKGKRYNDNISRSFFDAKQ